MRIFDGHCDTLYRLFCEPERHFHVDGGLDVTLPAMHDVGLRVQTFAIFVSDLAPYPHFDHVLELIRIFHERILSHPEMVFVRSAEDLMNIRQAEGKIGTLLTLEGVEALAANFTYLKICFYLGVRAVGLTWNGANWAADGVLEARQGGLTEQGRQLIQECQQLGMLVDVSHLCETAFWECMDLCEGGIYASHANAFAKCAHPRNLKDAQMKALFGKGGTIGVTFVPAFLREKGEATMTDILRHIDHMCALGGEAHVTLGSDFDGISHHVTNLREVRDYSKLADVLLTHYSAAQTDAFLFENAYRFFANNLPKRTVLS